MSVMNKIHGRRPTRFLLSVVLGLVCLSPALSFADDYAEQVEKIGAHYLNYDWTCEINGDKALVHYRYRIEVVNARGRLHTEIVHSEDRFSKIKSLKGEVIDAGGKSVYSRDKDDFTKYCGYAEYSVYSDNCTFYTDFESAAYPYIIKVDCVREYKTLFYLHGFSIRKQIPQDSICYELITDKDTKLRIKNYDLSFEPGQIPEEDQTRYTWVTSHVPALDDVDYAPAGYLNHERVAIAADDFSLGDFHYAGSSWNSIGQFCNRLYADRALRKDKYDNPPADRSGDIVPDCYDLVRGSVRYVSVQIGVGGWRPHDARQTQELGWGDCKDMSNLLVSHLRNNDIAAYPVLILTTDDGRTDPDFPNIAFNHVITMSIDDEGDTIWMDPTCDKCPYGELPWNDQNANVLVVTDSGGVLRKTPVTPPEDNSIRREIRWHVGPHFNVTAAAEIALKGPFATQLRYQLDGLDAEDTRLSLIRRFDISEKLFDIEQVEADNLDDLSQPVVVHLSATLKKPARKIGGKLYLDPFLLTASPTGVEREDLTDRKYPLNQFTPDSKTDRIIVSWDSTIRIDSAEALAGIDFNNDLGKFEFTFESFDDSVKITSLRESYVCMVDTSQFESYAVLRNFGTSALNQKLKLQLAN